MKLVAECVETVVNAVLPCRHRERTRGLTPNWLVWFGCVSYFAEWSELQVAENAEE